MNPKIAACLLGLAPLAIAASPAPAAAPELPDHRARFQGLFVDWGAVNRQSIDAERQARAPQPAPAAAVAGTAPGSRSLGERVGEIVAAGDCSEGERVARQAGDFALVAAVRDHCNARPGTPR